MTIHVRRSSVISYLFFVGSALLTGVLGSLLGRIFGGSNGFDMLIKPPLTPPAVLFPIVWTLLYIAIGSGAYAASRQNDPRRTPALRLYFFQLLLNLFWPFLFFRLGLRLTALIWLLALLAAVTLLLFSYYGFSKPAFFLTLPYWLWLLFATYLNAGFFILNR